MDKIIAQLRELITVFGVKVIAALAVLFVGWQVARFLKNLIQNIMTKGKVERTLVSFTGSLTYVGLMTFVVLSALGQIGVQTTSFMAVLGAAGLAIGLALQGSLANFAAGVLMIIFHPFRVGDQIQGAGVNGVVEEIQIFTTVLKTGDNKRVIVPNAKLTGDNITNFSAHDRRRVDMEFSVPAASDPDKIKSIIHDVVAKDYRILKDPVPTIGLSEFDDTKTKFVVRPWVNTTEYWNVYFDTMENIKKILAAEAKNQE
ncbi:MAG: mechanosensitive ion channel [Deltaproteobacteria bacterium]|nr:mechanosensitive ion channel [Deltaproteobacteria bacterium]MBF0510303.1 mechanosensitive ion channel [Deltaproteobacteria bacterium]